MLLPGRRACHRLLCRAIRKTYGRRIAVGPTYHLTCLRSCPHYHEHDLNMTLNADFSNNLDTSTARQNLLPPLRFLDERVIADLIGLHQLAKV
jgi:hypothetical protein